MMMFPAVSAITFFDGDVNQVVPFLRTRISKIIELSPWLQGRLIKKYNSIYDYFQNENIVVEYKKEDVNCE
jgi:hypothetical protein